MERLSQKEASSQGQIRTFRNLLAGEGLCTCGRVLKPLSPKFILANFTSDQDGKEAVLMAAYCYACFMQINQVLKNIKNSAINRKEMN